MIDSENYRFAGLINIYFLVFGALLEAENQKQWFVLRDLKRANAKEPAYKILESKNIEVFTPMRWCLTLCRGKKVRRYVPFVPDLVFAHDTRKHLDDVIAGMPTLQYRWLRNKWREPMVVPDLDMERFIYAAESSKTPQYYQPEEITSQMCGKEVRIVGGPLSGYQGRLLTVRGSKVKRLIVELKGFFCLGVEVAPEFIQFI